jgi:hypothetical protein
MQSWQPYFWSPDYEYENSSAPIFLLLFTTRTFVTYKTQNLRGKHKKRVASFATGSNILSLISFAKTQHSSSINPVSSFTTAHQWDNYHTAIHKSFTVTTQTE